MKTVKKDMFFSVLILLPYSLYAWGGGDRLSDGSCKFDKETGYSAFSLYIKNQKSYAIVDVSDRRYGTTSTVYNAVTCEKVTSGNKEDSNFDALMEKKGFVYTPVTYHHTINESYQNKIDFSQNEDNIMVKVTEIDSNTATELKTLISSLSDKSASSDISLSSSAKEFLGYKQFYETYTDKLSSLSPMEINYNYALSLNDKFKIENRYVENSKNIILAKQEKMQKIILAKQEANKRRVATNNRHTTSSYDNGYDATLALGTIIGGALVYKGIQAIGDMFSSSSSSSYSSYTPPSYEPCNSGDTCFKVLESRSNGAYTDIQCTKGPSTGEKKCLGYNNKGKYSSGCGLTDAFAHHYTFKEAGNLACEY